jgi:hypothetical protein
VHGHVLGPGRRGRAGLFVEILDCVVGGDVQVGSSVTADDGAFAVAVSETVQALPDLQARVWTSAEPDATFVGQSAVAYDVTDALVVLDVHLDADSVGLESEYDALARAAAPFVSGRLGDLEESDARSDVTHVSNKTGWDARAVAYATLADRLAGETGDQIAAPLFYSLLRAGLPSAPDLLFRTNRRSVESIWRDAIEHGLVDRDLSDRIPAALQAFEREASSRLLSSRAGGASSLDDILDLTFPADAESKTTIAGLQVRADSPEAFWEAVESSFGADTSERLKVDSELAILTLDNAPLIAALHSPEAGGEAGPLRGAVDLARRAFHRPERWADLLGDSVPDAIPGDTPEQRRDNYAEFLAAQVRLSFPTAVVAAKVSDGELAVADDAEVRDGVAAFLSEHVGRFELGVEPVDRFIAANDDVSAPDDPRVVEGVQRIQRLYQVTPDDDSLAVLLERGLDSATAIAAVPAAEFVRTRAEDLGEPTARVVHARAEQISDLVTNLAANYLTARTALPIGADGAILEAHEAAAAAGASPLPTLEGLFGSLSTAACEHCGSVLSPAAYLVDLLLFLERKQAVVNPLTVLLQRRPDIGHLPLTCENTNTLVPHIDLVTETLEHFVAHGHSLTGFAGHTTPRGLTSEEALAHPGFVDDAAYVELQRAMSPSPLPFHRHLEELRALLDRLGVSLADALRILRRDDQQTRPDGYGWRDIAREQAGISPPLARVLTDGAVPLPALLGSPDGTPVETVLADLGTVRGWASRLDLTYDEVDRVLSTRFVNPDVGLLPRLQRLGVGSLQLKALKDGALSPAAFRELLPDDLDVDLFDGDVARWVTDDARHRRIMGLLVAEPPPPPPSGPRTMPAFDRFLVRHVDPAPAGQPIRPVEARRLVRFVRLWRALGWSIEATDAALFALHDQAADDDDLDAAMETLIRRLGTVTTVARRLDLDVDEDLPSLLACWSDLETTGADALYRRLFLLGGAHHPAFAANEFGEVLSKPPTLSEGKDALRAALGVTADDLMEALGLDDDERLSLSTVSRFFRRTWLARTLGLAQRDFERLLRLTGIDPFGPPDQPGAGIIRLLDLVDGLAAIGATPVDAAAALWPEDDTGPDQLAPVVVRLARDVRARRRAADAGLEVGETVAPERVAELLTLRFGPPGRHFAALVNHALDVEVEYQQVESTLSDGVIDAGAGRLTFDPRRKRLAYAGAMTEATRDALKAAGPSTEDFAGAVDELFATSKARGLSDGAFAQLGSDLEVALREYPEFTLAWTAHLAEGASQSAGSAKRLLDSLLADTRAERHREDALAAVASTTGATPAQVVALLVGPGVLGADQGVTVVEAIGSPGLDLAPGGTERRGFLDVSESGRYRLGVRIDRAAQVSLTVDSVSVELEAAGELRRTKKVFELTADRLLPVKLTVDGHDGTPVLEWQRGTESWAPVPPDVLYGSTAVESLSGVLARFVAALRIDATFQLGPVGLRHLARLPSLRVAGEGWLSVLPVLGSRNEPQLGAVLEACVRFARLGRERGLDHELLVTLLENPAAERDVQGRPGDRLLLTAATGWDKTALTAYLRHRGLELAGLADLSELSMAAEAMALSSALATPLGSLLESIGPDPGAAAVGLAETALRARHGAGWLDVLKSVTDPLRIRRRDALVAYVLRALRTTRPDVDTPDKLFGFFLMDVQMQPPIATSRIRHAISAVQLFVERVLMHLDDEVPPEVFEDPGRWQALKRYRLWEANRQLFLWPENWLEPQLRTDQSPAFRRTMSELLQSDITEDTAATALLGYLSQLEEVAQLEPCAIHHDEGDPRFGDEVSHVVARTPGAQRRYYYRRRETGSWTAWEQVGLDIEDNPVLPTLWKGRLLLFWLRVVNTNPPMPALSPEAVNKPLTDVSLGELQDPSARNPTVLPKVVLCWSEYYNQRWQPPKTSDVAAPASFFRQFGITGDNVFDRHEVNLGVTVEGGVLRVRIRGPDYGTSFLFYNTYSLPQRQEDSPGDVMGVLDFAEIVRIIDKSTSTVTIEYQGPVTATRELVTRVDGTPYRITAPFHIGYQVDGDQQGLLRDPWLAPFLYDDGQHAFFVTTSSPLVTVSLRAGIGVVPPGPEGRPLPWKWVPGELRSGLGVEPPRSDRLLVPANVLLSGVEISASGRTSRALPHEQGVRRG